MILGFQPDSQVELTITSAPAVPNYHLAAFHMNRVLLTGHLALDPEFREISDGVLIAILSVVTNENWSDETGASHNRTERTRVSVHDRKFVEVARGLRKGFGVHIEGSLQTRYWIDHRDAEQYSTEVVLSHGVGKLVTLEQPKVRVKRFPFKRPTP